jgi:hypothetical protein
MDYLLLISLVAGALLCFWIFYKSIEFFDHV